MSGPESPAEMPPEPAPGRRRAAPARSSQSAEPTPTSAPTHARPAARPSARPPAGGYPLLPASGRPAARPPGARRADVARPDPLADPPSLARGSQTAPRPSPAHPPGRRIAPPSERRPDIPETGSTTETGSHARILEPIADPAPPTLKPPAPPTPPTSKVPSPPRSRRRTEARPPKPPKPARDRTDKSAARAEARAARASTAAPAAREAVAAKRAAEARAHDQQVVEVLAPAAARRAALRNKVGASTATITENEAWVGVLLLGALVVAVGRLAPDLPLLVRELGGLLVSGSLAWGLAVRTGGRPIWATVLTAALGATAISTDWAPLLAGASIGTGVLAASLAFLTTVPAPTFGAAIREALIATAVAWVGALGVIAYRDPEQVDVDKFGYVVFALSLVAAFALVYRLGAGLHGLGRRGYVVMGGAALLLFFVMAYTEAISQYGSRDVVDVLDGVRSSVRDTLGAVPHPITALLGYPALVWGVFMRARRRQGWWVCAFGVAATAPAATRMMGTDLDVSTVVLGEVYSLVVGFALGYLVIRGEQAFTGSRGRRARRDEEAVAHRPEPRRTRPLH